jgi:hypothetical protein
MNGLIMLHSDKRSNDIGAGPGQPFPATGV